MPRLAVVVASTTDIAVPNAVAAAVAVFAQDLVCTLPSCVSVFGDIMEGCWCRAKGHPEGFTQAPAQLPSS